MNAKSEHVSGVDPGFEKKGGGGRRHMYRGHLCSLKKIIVLEYTTTLPLFTFTSICKVTACMEHNIAS